MYEWRQPFSPIGDALGFISADESVAETQHR